MHRRDARVMLCVALGTLWLAVTMYETLRPIGWIQAIPFWTFWDETMAGVDIVQNIVLFLPLGWIARRAGWPAWRAILVGFAISGSIEFAQQWIPGRTSTAMDIVSNTTGAALGWWMASRAAWPRARRVLALAALTVFVGLHVLSTAWPSPVEVVGGSGGWSGVRRVACALPARASTACLELPNTPETGPFVRVAGPEEATYARVDNFTSDRRMGRGDCVRAAFESTFGARLRLRPAVTLACDLVDSTDRVVLLRLDPRLEHEAWGPWTPTRVGVWMWPVWPFVDYWPTLLQAAGALTFIVVAALFAGEASWALPTGYLAILAIVAKLTDMRGPGLWDLACVAIGWLIALGAVQIDGWWRDRSAR